MAKVTKKEHEKELERKRNLRERARREAAKFREELTEQMLKLATSGFGLVAALAWNDLIKKFIAEYIQPVAGESSGFVSLLIYALIVTVLAVAVTYSLSRIKETAKRKTN